MDISQQQARQSSTTAAHKMSYAPKLTSVSQTLCVVVAFWETHEVQNPY